MPLHHVTYHVPPGTLEGPALKQFMSLLGFHERDPSHDGLEDGWNVRWFAQGWPRPAVALHFVEGKVKKHEGLWNECEESFDRLALGHFCVKVGQSRYDGLRKSEHCVRDSGSGRIWLAFANLRVEVRP